MSVGTVLLIVPIVLILMLLGAVPIWSQSRNWGYASIGGFGLVALVAFVLLVTGRP